MERAVCVEAETLGLAWQTVDGRPSAAEWLAEGVRYRATIRECPEGWEEMGQHVYGTFGADAVPGALRVRDQRARQQFGGWFTPVDPARGQSLLHRASAFGRTWRYLALTVEAFRGGHRIGREGMAGLESDAPTWTFTDLALECAAHASAALDRQLDLQRLGHAGGPETPPRWLITADVVGDDPGAVGMANFNAAESPVEPLPFTFRLLDADGEVLYFGQSNDRDSAAAFGPLDWAAGRAGCVTIEYHREEGWVAL
jgi:hypothetical protein